MCVYVCVCVCVGCCIYDFELVQVPYTRLKFLWYYGPQGGDAILKKLDWIFVNLFFFFSWLNAHSEFLLRDHSDHSAMILQLGISVS